jgi:hypothetical protein
MPKYIDSVHAINRRLYSNKTPAQALTPPADHFAFRLFFSLFCLLSILRRVFRTDISIEHEFLINVRSLGRNIVYCVIQNFIEADPLTPLLRDVIYENLSFENIFIKNIRTKNLCDP